MSRVALVTGATSGIGRAAAVALAADGWWVAAHGRDEERGREVAAELGDRGAFFRTELDESLVDAVLAARGRLDLLVNNAAVYARGTVADLQPQDLDRLLAVNLRAAVLLAGAAVRAMGERGGVVVNVASEAGLVAVPGQVAYNVTKAALIHLTRTLAMELSPSTRVNALAPGLVKTDMARALWEPNEERMGKAIPMGRLGEPVDIANAALFLASDLASWITGHTLIVDGGAMLGVARR